MIIIIIMITIMLVIIITFLGHDELGMCRIHASR